MTADGHFKVPTPVNEPVRAYAPGDPYRKSLKARLAELTDARTEVPMQIGGERRWGSSRADIRSPHRHELAIAEYAVGGGKDFDDAVSAALKARRAWAATSFNERAAVLLRAASLLAGPWRDTINAATMLGQSKTVHQAEIDAAPTAAALMGNTVVFKPATQTLLVNHFLMEVLNEAGLPPGVINMVSGSAQEISEQVLNHKDLAGIHFTGSTEVFQGMWRTVGQNVDHYRTYPRLVGETGGKDFVVAHESADSDALRTALIRGAFEYQGQKCSAASRAYIPQSMWKRLRSEMADEVEAIPQGDVADFRNFMGAVIDGKAYSKHMAAIDFARKSESAKVVAGGKGDDKVGWFVRPTVIETTDPDFKLLKEELFGPILTVYPSTPRATSTSMTSPQARSSACNRLAARARRAPTTKPVRSSISSAGPARASSRRHTRRLPITAIHSWTRSNPRRTNDGSVRARRAGGGRDHRPARGPQRRRPEDRGSAGGIL